MRHNQSFFILILLLIAGLAGLFLFFEFNKFEKDISQIFGATISSPSLKEKSSSIKMIFVGDIMLDRGVDYMIKNYGGGDFRFPFLNIADDFKQADVLFGNLESVISDKGQKAGSIYSFQAKPEAMEGLKYAGFDILSVANNHIFDYGRLAMEDNFKRLAEAGIDFAGGSFSKKEACSPIIKEIKGTRIAFLAYTNLGSRVWEAQDNRSGICWLDERIADDVKKAKENSDIAIVSIHWGEEYQQEPNKEQKYFGHLTIDVGADLVVGHHPHIIQEIEEYKEGYIAYSLGNFVFDQGFSEETMKGLMLEILIEDKTIKKIIPKEIIINKFFQPELAEEL